MAKRQNKLRKGENLTKRSNRYARELKSGKSEITGKELTVGQKIFRGGVLNERSISASQYKYKQSNKKSSKPKRGKSTGKSKPNFGQDNLPNPDDIHGSFGGLFLPVDDFDYDDFGNIKGHCVGGNLNKFEPD